MISLSYKQENLRLSPTALGKVTVKVEGFEMQVAAFV